MQSGSPSQRQPSDKMNICGNISVKRSSTKLKWVIENFVTLAAIEKSWSSPTYILSESRHCYFQLDLESADGSGQDFLSLYMHSNYGDYKAKISFCLLSSSDSEWYDTGRSKTFLFKAVGEGFGFPKFMERSQLMSKPALLPNNSLTIGCKVIFDSTMYEDGQSVTSVCDLHRTKILDDYAKLLDDEKFSDIKFVVDGKEIFGHKNIIACRTPVFSAMFDNAMTENEQNIVNIIDFSYKAVLELLRYIYGGVVEDLNNVAPDLLMASNKYLMDDLKAICEDCLCLQLSFENVVQYLNLAHLHNASLLKTKAIDFISQHAEEIVDSPAFDVCKIDLDLMQKVFYCVAKSRKNKAAD